MDQKNYKAICKTINLLIEGHDVSDEVLTISLNQANERQRHTFFNCRKFGSDLHFQATLALLENCYRYCQAPDLIAGVLSGGFGRSITGMAIAAAMKNTNNAKRIRKKMRTSFSVQRNLYEENESIFSIANGILFCSEESRHFVIPKKVSIQQVDPILGVSIGFITCQNYFGKDVEFVASCQSFVLDGIKEICEYNTQQTSPETLHWVNILTRENELFKDLFPNSEVWRHSIIRPKTILKQSTRSLIISAFFVAAGNWLQLELGMGRMPYVYMEEALNNARTTLAQKEKMVPLLALDKIHVKKPLEKRILKEIMDHGDRFESPGDVFDSLVQSMNSPPDRKTFNKYFKNLVDITTRMIDD